MVQQPTSAGLLLSLCIQLYRTALSCGPTAYTLYGACGCTRPCTYHGTPQPRAVYRYAPSPSGGQQLRAVHEIAEKQLSPNTGTFYIMM